MAPSLRSARSQRRRPAASTAVARNTRRAPAEKSGATAAEARTVCVMEGVKASCAAAVVSVAAHVAGMRLSPTYAGANYRLKTLFWSSVVVSAFWVRSEQEATRQARLKFEVVR